VSDGLTRQGCRAGPGRLRLSSSRPIGHRALGIPALRLRRRPRCMVDP
jgi:hypothetical protein